MLQQVVIRTISSTSLAVLVTCLCACKTLPNMSAATPITVTFSHNGASPTTTGDVHAANGQQIRILITGTNSNCFAFNAAAVAVTNPSTGSRSRPLAQTSVEFDVEMRDDPLDVTIEARKINADDPECRALGLTERYAGGPLPPWKVRVLREGWDIAFAGAYTADTVTNPVYGLVVAQKQVDPAPAPKTTGFFVKRFPEQEDSYRLGAAAMVHVFHTSPTAFSWRDIAWAPISFGLGVGESSQVRYFLGTGLRFGPKFFLTGGAVIGSVKTLPAGLTANNSDDPSGFTTNANALNSLPSRTRAGAFISVSYTFAGVGASSFSGPFTPVQPPPAGGQSTPAAAQTPPAGGQSTSAVADFAIQSSADTVTVKQGESASVTITSSVSGGFSAPITLTTDISSGGPTPTLAPTTFAAPGSGTATLTIAPTAATTAATYQLKVTAAGADKKHVLPITLTVTPP